MNKITNYTELVAARKTVETKIETQKMLMREGIVDIQEKLKPFLYLLPVLNVFKKEEQGNSLLKGIASLGIDVLLGQNLLAKSNWLTRLVVPLVAKVFSSKVIENATKPSVAE